MGRVSNERYAASFVKASGPVREPYTATAQVSVSLTFPPVISSFSKASVASTEYEAALCIGTEVLQLVIHRFMPSQTVKGNFSAQPAVCLFDFDELVERAAITAAPDSSGLHSQ